MASLGNSSVEPGTPGLFTEVSYTRDVICRCCGEHQDYGSTAWEFPNGDWLCLACASLVRLMRDAGPDRSHLVLAYLGKPLVTKTGWDL